MSTNNFTPIIIEADANASVVNTPLGQLDAAIGALTSLATTAQTSLVAALNEIYSKTVAGGATVTNAQLVAWTESESYEPTSVTMDTTYPLVPSTATVKWPDGSAGTYTTTTINDTWEAVDAYTVTHTASSKTVTQAAVTRDVNGRVTVKPALTIA